MIDLTNGELLDVIPAEKADADSKARSYAIRLAMQYVIQESIGQCFSHPSTPCQNIFLIIWQ